MTMSRSSPFPRSLAAGRTFIGLVPASVLVLLLVSPPPAWPARPVSSGVRPNVVIIIADDLGYGELSCQGNSEIPTPHIDSLARRGVRFTQGYVTASYCSPSRAGLLTGRYQTRFGHERNPIGKFNHNPLAALPPGEPTLAERLRQAGYRTALIGKWHLGAAPGSRPQERGFGTFYGFLHEGHYYEPPPYRGVFSFLRKSDLPPGPAGRLQQGNTVWSNHTGTDEPPYDLQNPILDGYKVVEDYPYLTDAITDRAIDFIAQQSHQPFFLVLSYNAVHSPMQARLEDLQRVGHISDLHRRVFAAMLVRLDDGIGRILQALKDAGIEENTMVWFLSDHGGPTRELTSRNGHFRGGKGTLYEGGIRVPMLLQWPARVRGSALCDLPVISLDIGATILAAAGVALPGEPPLDGIDLLPVLESPRQAPERVFYWRMVRRAALRAGRWKLVGRRSSPGANWSWELYDLSADPAEQNDQADRRQDLLQQLVAQWEALDRQMVPPRWEPDGSDPYAH